jgi:hypothetical protein
VAGAPRDAEAAETLGEVIGGGLPAGVGFEWVVVRRQSAPGTRDEGRCWVAGAHRGAEAPGVHRCDKQAAKAV